MQQDVLYSGSVDKLIHLLEETVRSTEEGVKRFVPPTPSALSSAVSKRHHMVFGRRGSGKSSLLRKAAADLTLDRRPIAYIDLEAFKGHSYPDVLISVLIKTFEEYRQWLTTAAVNPANKKSFWLPMWGAAPSRPAFPKEEASAIASLLRRHIDVLHQQLYAADGAAIQVSTKTSQSVGLDESVSLGAGIKGLGVSVSAGQNSNNNTSRELQEQFSQSKVDFIHQHIMEYQSVFQQISRLSQGDSYLFLDDLYHIRRSDQVKVLDYFHRLAKNNHLWLKVGTIRHRTKWYVHSDPPMGMQLGADAGEIDLDLTLEKFGTTKKFLTEILQGLLTEAGDISLGDILIDEALARLVLASGGVARDFLGIFHKAIEIARNREGKHRRNRPVTRVIVEDVNSAAGDYDIFKRQELERDTLDERFELEHALENIRAFCFHKTRRNILLLDRDAKGQGVDDVAELVDLRLLHKIKSRLTSWGREGKYYEAYMLDISQYTGSRKQHDFTMVNFWTTAGGEDSDSHGEDKLRQSSNVYDPSEDYTKLKVAGRAKSSVGTQANQPTNNESGLEQGDLDWDDASSRS